MGNDSFAQRLYASMAWKKTRQAYMTSVHGLCEECLKQGLIVPATQVHHITPLRPENIDDPEITLGWDNLKALCDTHHAEAHKGKPGKFGWDENGNLVEPSPPGGRKK